METCQPLIEGNHEIHEQKKIIIIKIREVLFLYDRDLTNPFYTIFIQLRSLMSHELAKTLRKLIME